jgi:Fe-S cluster assembly protein SufD
MGIEAPAKDLSPRLEGIALADIEVPKGREEEWRFTPLKRLKGLHSLSEIGNQSDFEILSLGSFLHSRIKNDSPFAATDRLAAAAALLPQHVETFTLAKETVSENVLKISFPQSSDSSSLRMNFLLERYSKGTIFLAHHGSGVMSSALEFVVGEGAQVTVVSIFDTERTAVTAGQHSVNLGKDATLNHIVLTLGGDLVRLTTTVKFTGTGATANLTGGYFTDAGQHHEHRLFVDHAVEHCTSDVMYKGALQGDDAHSVWVGDVLIRGNAIGTSTYELNRNLLLTEGTRADSVPNLEIETGNIQGAGHAAATGRFDDEQIFYLMSRGVPEVQAKRLVVRGFLADVIARIPDQDLRNSMIAGVEKRLGQSDPRFDGLFNE